MQLQEGPSQTIKADYDRTTTCVKQRSCQIARLKRAHLLHAGVICNNVVPEWLRVVLLTALLLFVVYKTAKKGKR